jgi:hypothetical protein
MVKILARRRKPEETSDKRTAAKGVLRRNCPDGDTAELIKVRMMYLPITVMPGLTVFTLKKLKQDRSSGHHYPLAGPRLSRSLRKHGAKDYLTKPYKLDER